MGSNSCNSSIQEENSFMDMSNLHSVKGNFFYLLKIMANIINSTN